MTTRTVSDRMKALLEWAMQFPEASEGIACEGTPAQKRTINARDKAFLFLGTDDAMFKLRESLAQATRLCFEQPQRFKVGAHGWVTATLGDDGAPPLEVLQRWVAESYKLIAPKSLSSRPPPSPAKEPEPERKAKPAAQPAAKASKKKTKKK